MKKATEKEVMGTGYKGSIDTSYEVLVATFGEPKKGSADGKVRASWAINANGAIITIYDYKDKNPLEKVRDWHVGGKGWKDNYDGIETVVNHIFLVSDDISVNN